MQSVQNKLFYGILLALLAYIIYLLSPILTPFLIAGFLAYLVNPLVNWCMRFQLSRNFCVVIISILLFFIILLLVLLLAPFIQNQITIFLEKLPDMVNWLQHTFSYGLAAFDINVEQPVDGNAMKSFVLEHWTKANGLINGVFNLIIHSGYRVFELVINIILIPVVTLYLLADWPQLIASIKNMLPKRQKPKILALFRECDSVLSAFLRGQLLVMLALSTLYSLGLTLIGLQTGLLIGIIAGLLSFIPYLGLVFGMIIASISALVQFGTPVSILWVIICFTIIQTIDQIFITPRLIGNKLGLHPVIVIFSLLAGGKLFGFVGVLLALPTTAVLLVCIRYIYFNFLPIKMS